MSKSIKVQLSKSIHNSKFETLLNSYTSLKSILSPNLTENNNIFMNSLIDLIISQIKIFLKLLSFNHEKKIFKLITSNNQELSKQIASLYELAKNQTNNKISLNSTSKKNRNEYNKIFNQKESYTIEEKRESFQGNKSDNLDNFDFNNKTESKEGDIDKENYTKEKNTDINIDKNKNTINDNDQSDLNKITPKNLNDFKEGDEFIKVNKPEKEKNQLIKSLNSSNNKIKINIEKKESEQNNKMKKLKKSKNKYISNKNQTNQINNQIVEKDIKTPLRRNNISITNYSKYRKYFNTSKSIKYDYSTFKSKNNNLSKKNFKEKEKGKEKEKEKEKGKGKEKLIHKKINQKRSNNENKDIKEKDNIKFERKAIKAKTVVYQTIPIPILISIKPIEKENSFSEKNNKGKSITYSNRKSQNFKTPNNLKYKYNNLIKIKNLRNKSSSTNSSFKKINTDKKKLRKSDYFSLDEFLIPHTGLEGEQLFYTKKGKVLINKNQKDILEDYVNNYLCDEEESKSSIEKNDKLLSNKSIRDKLINLNPKKTKNKKYVIKGTSLHYNLKDVTDLLQILPKSFNIPIDDFYLKRKRASIFDRGIFQICHKVIDNYKKLEGKEDLYGVKKTNSNSHHKKK